MLGCWAVTETNAERKQTLQTDVTQSGVQIKLTAKGNLIETMQLFLVISDEEAT